MARMSSEMKRIAKEQKKRILAVAKGSTLKSPTSALAPTSLSLSNEHEKDKNVEMSGLSDTQFCMTPKNLASVLGSMVGDTLSYPNDEKRDLVQQFGVYFSKLGWDSEDHVSAIAGANLPIPNCMVKDANIVGTINPAIRLTLQNITQLIATVRRPKL